MLCCQECHDYIFFNSNDYKGMIIDLEEMFKNARTIMYNCNYGSNCFPYPKEWQEFIEEINNFQYDCLKMII